MVRFILIDQVKNIDIRYCTAQYSHVSHVQIEGQRVVDTLVGRIALQGQICILTLALFEVELPRCPNGVLTFLCRP